MCGLLFFFSPTQWFKNNLHQWSILKNKNILQELCNFGGKGNISVMGLIKEKTGRREQRLFKEMTAEKQRAAGSTRERALLLRRARVGCQLTELRCESENWAARGLSGNVPNVESF